MLLLDYCYPRNQDPAGGGHRARATERAQALTATTTTTTPTTNAAAADTTTAAAITTTTTTLRIKRRTRPTRRGRIHSFVLNPGSECQVCSSSSSSSSSSSRSSSRSSSGSGSSSSRRLTFLCSLRRCRLRTSPSFATLEAGSRLCMVVRGASKNQFFNLF